MQESFTEQFGELHAWEQQMILSSLYRLVTMMDAKQIAAAPMLTTGAIEPPPEEPRVTDIDRQTIILTESIVK